MSAVSNCGSSVEPCLWFLPVCLTHGLRPPDEAAIFKSADGVWVVSQQRIFRELLLIGWAVDQHGVHHFLFIEDGLKHPHDGRSTGAKLETMKEI